ncbi:MAG: glycoside hydrolase family 2 TIM barrel-domain containing protein [Bacteroidota bacterium]
MRFLLCCLLLCSCLPLTAQERGDRQKIRINLDWRFHLGDPDGDPTRVDYDDGNWERVAVPHAPELVSLEMDSTTDVRPQLEYLRDVAWYRRQQVIPDAPGMRFVLEFEGVHQVTDLWVNGRHVGQYTVGGYTPFHFDVTEFVRPGETATVVVRADNSANEHTPPDPHKTDYVKYGGIYRDVYLVVTNPLHVTYNYEDFDAGVHLTTPSVRKHDATVSVKTTVRNAQSAAVTARLVTRLIDADGTVLKTMEARTQVPGGGKYSFRQSTVITENLRLWSPDDPYLYRVHSTLYAGDDPVDFVENTLGIRWFELVDGHRFMLNGEPLWLVGVNRHQNYPIIGDATPDALGVAEAQRYKDAGMNCIRLSHYTQDESFIAACDRLGLLVYEEAPTWIDWGDQRWWDNLEAALRTTIRAHRNHPSIILWGAGINHRGDVPMMHLAAKEEDPWRLTASASSNGWTGRPNAGVSDIYATMDYRNAILPDGDWAISMEHRNTHDAEGNQLVINRYLKTPRTFGALAWVGADYNQIIMRNDRISYRSHSGVLDGFRVPRPVYHWYRAEYGKEPMVHIADERGSYDGIIRVFSNAEEVALYLDGKLLGKTRPERGENKNYLDHPTFYFHHDFTAGTHEARAIRGGKLVATHTRTKAGTPAKIAVRFGETAVPFEAGGSDVRIVHASVTDAVGNLVSTADHPLTFRVVSGPGELVDDPAKDIHPTRPEFGQSGMYVRGTDGVGEIVVEVSSPGLTPGRARITTVPYEADALTDLQPFRDLPEVRLDVGKEGTLNEIGWTPLATAATTQLADFAGATLSVSAGGVEWSDNATMFGNLAYVGADGVFTTDRQFSLEFAGLPAGTYRLKTYHHPRRDGPLLNQVAFTIRDNTGERKQKGRRAPMGYWDKSRIMEQEPLSGEIVFTVGATGKALVQVYPVGDKEGAFWLNGLILGRIR